MVTLAPRLREHSDNEINSTNTDANTNAIDNHHDSDSASGAGGLQERAAKDIVVKEEGDESRRGDDRMDVTIGKGEECHALTRCQHEFPHT